MGAEPDRRFLKQPAAELEPVILAAQNYKLINVDLQHFFARGYTFVTAVVGKLLSH